MMKILVSKNQRYSCMMCGKCCRRFNVRIEPHEVERISKLDWGDVEHPTDFYETINGHFYFRRRPDGGCVFLNRQGVCSIHATFGFEAKALTCRGYPMNIISVTPDQLSVLARMDCPAVLANHGEPLVKAQRDIMRLVAEMKFGQGFDSHARDGMAMETIGFICQELHKVVRDRQLELPRRIRWMHCLAKSCQKLGPTFLNDLPTLKTVWLNLLAKAAQNANQEPVTPKPTRWEQLVFRSWLALYTRRDEEHVSRGLGTRLRNFRNNFGFIRGTAPWNTMGKEHPDISSRQAGLFQDRLEPDFQDETWKPFLDFMVNRIDTMQFFGAAFYDQGFFRGLQALADAFLLVLATAKVHAAAQKRGRLCEQDVFDAVLSVDHCHGRSPALNSVSARFYETFAADRFLNYAYAF